MRRIPLLAVAAALLLAPAARADGDPASDVLIAQDVFFPYTQKIPADQVARIQAGVMAANKSGYRLKVAIIAGRTDLGLIQGLWLKPKQYGPFLGRELQFLYKGTLVVEMPNGFGVFSPTRGVVKEQRALDGVKVGPGAKGLGDGMIAALGRLSPAAARATGKSSGGGGGGSETLDRILIGVAAAVLLVAVLLAGRAVRRRRGASSPG